MRDLILGAALALCGTTRAAAGDSLGATVDALAAEALKGPVAGLSVAVGRGGAVLLAKGYGFANVELEAPASADTVYHVASITKFMTAAAILKLVDEGRVSLDDDLGRWVPGLSTAERPVRLRHLLSHTSGLPSYTSLPGFREKERLDLGHDEVLAPVRAALAHFAPGEGWRYSNTGYYLAGMVIEKVTGQAYRDYMRAQIFEPLGMRDSRYGEERPLVRNRAAGYEVEGGHLVNAAPLSWRQPFAGGAVVSTALDLLKWTDGLAHGRLLKPGSVSAMWSPSRLADGTPIDYGLGTRLGTLSGHPMLGHTGNGGGFRNALLFFPEDDLTVAVLTNTDAGSAVDLAVRVARAALGLGTEAAGQRSLPPGAAAAYAGRYESDEGPVTLVEREGSLRFRENDADVTGQPLAYLGHDTFRIHGETVGRFLMKDGKARAAAVYSAGLFMDAMMRVP